MKLFPKYCENIIVGVVYRGAFRWYCTEKLLWVMDLEDDYANWKKWYLEHGRSEERFLRDLGDFETFCRYRWGIAVLNENTVGEFLEKIADNAVDCGEIAEYFAIVGEDKCDFMPVLYVDFDSRMLFSQNPEPDVSYEDHVPKNWHSAYQNFEHLIPHNMMWWR